MAQADGYYPRVNAAMLQSGKFDGMIVSMMGRIQNANLGEGSMEFTTSDNGMIPMDISNSELPEGALELPPNDRPVMEAVGQVTGNGAPVVLFITRELSNDTNMDAYNKMLAVQHNPKYASYFAPVTGPSVIHG